MAPISTTITELEVRTKPSKTYSLQNGLNNNNINNNKANQTISNTKERTLADILIRHQVGNGMPLKWMNIILIFAINIWAVISVFRVTYTIPLFMWGVVMGTLSGFGVTGGVHRYWTHKTYKANLPMRIILMICYCSAGQNSIYDWVRDHRVHHKFSDTDADPHNARHGFFFSHCGWLMQQKHPEVIRRGNQIDMSDVMADPVVQFAQKYFVALKLFFCFVLPTFIPIYFWGFPFWDCFMSQCLIRYTTVLNSTWSVNSAAHIWGYKPYDTSIKPAENKIVSFLALGEGWHNYHHVFPWDYKAAELGNYHLNNTTFFLDQFAKIGWVWDRKQPTQQLIDRVLVKNALNSDHPTEVPEDADDNYTVPDAS